MKIEVMVMSCVLLSACNPLNLERNEALIKLNGIDHKLQFACKIEVIPEPPEEADVLFKYARWLQKNNQLTRDPAVNSELERLYRISAQHLHAKANINLQNGSMRGHFKLKGWEHLRLSEQLIDEGVATGYLYVAYFLQQGSATLQEDQEMALRYMRKAADEGNAQAQYHLGEMLAPIDRAPAIALDLYRCAAQQGHGEASIFAGLMLRDQHKYNEALEVLQKGIEGGYESSAWRLQHAFEEQPVGAPRYFGQEEDLERASRYRAIWSILADYSYAGPKVPEIDEIVPLPPADLPPWDGKLQWVEERRANVPPEKPSEALIHKLAKEKLLDPATGRPLPGSPAFSQTDFPLMTCLSGDACPATGYWKRFTNGPQDHIQYFQEGDIMPNYKFSWTKPRIWPFADEVIHRSEVVEWGFIG